MENLFSNTKHKLSSKIKKMETLANKVSESAKKKLSDTSGQLLVDHAGWTCVIVVVIGLVLVLSYSWIQGTLWPAVQSKIMGLINYSG